MISEEKNASQIYLEKSLFIDSKTNKITDDYKFLKEVNSNSIQLGRGVSGVVYQACYRKDPKRMRAIKKVEKKKALSDP